MLQDDALDGQLDGLQLRLGWSDINQAFAAGQVGMYVSGSDVYTNLVQASNINPSIYGADDDPARQQQERRRPRRRHARRGQAGRDAGADRGGREVDRLLLRAAARQRGAGGPQREDAVAVEAAGRRAGAADLQQGAVRPRATPGSSPTSTFRSSQMTPFTDGIFSQTADPGARGVDPERLPRARLGRARRCSPTRTRTSRACSSRRTPAAQSAISAGNVERPLGRSAGRSCSSRARPTPARPAPRRRDGDDRSRDAHGRERAEPALQRRRRPRRRDRVARRTPVDLGRARRPLDARLPAAAAPRSSGRSRGTRSCAR